MNKSKTRRQGFNQMRKNRRKSAAHENRYPKELARKITMGKGKFLFRPIKASDVPKMGSLFKSFSRKTIGHRFLHPIKEMTDETLAGYCNANYSRDMAIVVEDLNEKGKPLVAVGRLMRGNAKNAEFALVITDKYQRKGFGTKLLKQLGKIALGSDIKKIWALTDAENSAMISLAEKEGYKQKKTKDGEIYIWKNVSKTK